MGAIPKGEAADSRFSQGTESNLSARFPPHPNPLPQGEREPRQRGYAALLGNSASLSCCRRADRSDVRSPDGTCPHQNRIASAKLGAPEKRPQAVSPKGTNKVTSRWFPRNHHQSTSSLPTLRSPTPRRSGRKPSLLKEPTTSHPVGSQGTAINRLCRSQLCEAQPPGEAATGRFS